MSSHWLEMRIQEEKERRERESQTLAQLPSSLETLHRELADCVESYIAAFGPRSAELELQGDRIHVTVRDERDGKWETRTKLEITAVPSLPGFQIERAEQPPLCILIGLLPGDKIFYRDQDQYITLEELSRRILDRALFPKLAE